VTAAALRGATRAARAWRARGIVENTAGNDGRLTGLSGARRARAGFQDSAEISTASRFCAIRSFTISSGRCPARSRRAGARTACRSRTRPSAFTERRRCAAPAHEERASSPTSTRPTSTRPAKPSAACRARTRSRRIDSVRIPWSIRREDPRLHASARLPRSWYPASAACWWRRGAPPHAQEPRNVVLGEAPDGRVPRPARCAASCLRDRAAAARPICEAPDRGKARSPVEISAEILKALRLRAEAAPTAVSAPSLPSGLFRRMPRAPHRRCRRVAGSKCCAWSTSDGGSVAYGLTRARSFTRYDWRHVRLFLSLERVFQCWRRRNTRCAFFRPASPAHDWQRKKTGSSDQVDEPVKTRWRSLVR